MLNSLELVVEGLGLVCRTQITDDFFTKCVSIGIIAELFIAITHYLISFLYFIQYDN